MKRRMDPVLRPVARLGMDYVFIGLLFWVSTTGLALLALRETSLMGLMLAIHLGVVYAFFGDALFEICPWAVSFCSLASGCGEKR